MLIGTPPFSGMLLSFPNPCGNSTSPQKFFMGSSSSPPSFIGTRLSTSGSSFRRFQLAFRLSLLLRTLHSGLSSCVTWPDCQRNASLFGSKSIGTL
eukprot:939990-Amphidinium_carterae.1